VFLDRYAGTAVKGCGTCGDQGGRGADVRTGCGIDVFVRHIRESLRKGLRSLVQEESREPPLGLQETAEKEKGGLHNDNIRIYELTDRGSRRWRIIAHSRSEEDGEGWMKLAYGQAQNVWWTRLTLIQGLVHMGKGTIGLNPFYHDGQIMSRTAIAGLLAVLVSMTEAKSCKLAAA
jgi:hypothetical protein